MGKQIGELNQETKLKNPQQDQRMTKGNTAAVSIEKYQFEVPNSDQIAPSQTKQKIATRIDHNEEENNGQQNEEEEEEVDTEQCRLEDEVAHIIEEIKLISPKQRPHLHRINNKQTLPALYTTLFVFHML